MAKIINAWRTPSRDCLIVISESKVLVASRCLALVCTEIELIYSPPRGNPLNRLTFSKYSNNIIWAMAMTAIFRSLCESNLHIFPVHYFLPLITLWNWRTHECVALARGARSCVAVRLCARANSILILSIPMKSEENEQKRPVTRLYWWSSTQVSQLSKTWTVMWRKKKPFFYRHLASWDFVWFNVRRCRQKKSRCLYGVKPKTFTPFITSNLI